MMTIFYEGIRELVSSSNKNKGNNTRKLYYFAKRENFSLFENIKRSAVSKVMFVCFFAFILGMVSGCTSSGREISIIPNEPTPTLNLQLPEPLILDKEYEWRLFKDENDKIILGLTEEGYKIHQRNMEAIQGRLYLLMEYLNQYRVFYEGDESSPRT